MTGTPGFLVVMSKQTMDLATLQRVMQSVSGVELVEFDDALAVRFSGALPFSTFETVFNALEQGLA